MYTRRAWKLAKGIEEGAYKFPERTSDSIRSLAEIENAFILFVVFLLLLIFPTVSYSGSIMGFYLLIFSGSSLLVVVWLWIRRKRYLSVWKCISTLSYEVLPHPECMYLSLEHIGTKTVDDQVALFEQRLYSMARDVTALKASAETHEDMQLVSDAHAEFGKVYNIVHIAGFTEKRWQDFFEK